MSIFSEFLLRFAAFSCLLVLELCKAESAKDVYVKGRTNVTGDYDIQQQQKQQLVAIGIHIGPNTEYKMLWISINLADISVNQSTAPAPNKYTKFYFLPTYLSNSIQF